MTLIDSFICAYGRYDQLNFRVSVPVYYHIRACLDVRIKYRIRFIFKLNIYLIFSKFSWIELKAIKFELNPKIMRLITLIYTYA